MPAARRLGGAAVSVTLDRDIQVAALMAHRLGLKIAKPEGQNPGAPYIACDRR